MNRNLIVTVSVVVLIIIATGAYMFLNQPKTPPVTPSENNSQPSVEASVITEKVSLKSIMNMTGTQKCQFSDTETGNSGEVYLASGKFRGDFSSKINGKVVPSHMINDSKDIYIWMDDQQTGFKTTLEAIEQVSGTTGVSQNVDINKDMDYKCESWSIDPEKFVVPSDKKFNDMSKMMQDAAKMMQSASADPSVVAGNNAAACAACEKLQDSAEAECKAVLKCI